MGGRVPAEQHRGGPASHLRNYPGPAGRGLVGQCDQPAPVLGPEVVLQAVERDRAAGLLGDGPHPGELGLGIEHVAGELEHAGASVAERPADADQLIGAGGGARRQLAVLGAVQQCAGRREADRPGLDRLAHDLGHGLDLVGCRLGVLAAAVAHHVRPHGAVGDERAHVDGAGHAVELVEVLGERLPVPAHALGEGGAGDVLDALHELDQPRPLGRVGRGEADAAVAHDDGGYAVPARRADLGIPRGLAVVVGVDVDEAGRDQAPVGVDLAPPRSDVGADGDDAVAVDGDVRGARGADRARRSVDHRPAADDEVVHRLPPRG